MDKFHFLHDMFHKFLGKVCNLKENHVKEVKTTIGKAELVLCTGLKWGVPPVGSYGGQGGLSFLVGAKGR